MRAAILFLALVVVGLMSLQPVPAFSHPGGTNAQGCHTNRQTGDYHCHTPKAPIPGAITYCHVLNGQNRCGYAFSTCNSLVSQFGGSCRRQ